MQLMSRTRSNPSYTLQVRMGNGEEFLEESPYKSLDDLWDGEQ